MFSYRVPLPTLSPLYFKTKDQKKVYRIYIINDENVFYTPDDNGLVIQNTTTSNNPQVHMYKSSDNNIWFSQETWNTLPDYDQIKNYVKTTKNGSNVNNLINLGGPPHLDLHDEINAISTFFKDKMPYNKDDANDTANSDTTTNDTNNTGGLWKTLLDIINNINAKKIVSGFTPAFFQS